MAPDSQQLGCVAAEDGYALGVAQARRIEDMIDRARSSHRGGIIHSQKDLTGPGCRHPMPQTLAIEDDGVEIELLEIFKTELKLEKQKEIRNKKQN